MLIVDGLRNLFRNGRIPFLIDGHVIRDPGI